MSPSVPFLRRVMPLLAALFLAACLGGDEGAFPLVRDPSLTLRPEATPTPTPVPTPTPEPTPTATPPPPSVLEVMADFAYQGGLLLVRLLNPPQADVSLAFAGSSYPMVREGPLLFAVIAIATDFPPGDYPLAAIAAGESIAGSSVSVAAADFPVEYITLAAETAALLTDAAAIAEEKRTLAAIYAGFTPRRLWSGAWGLPAQGAITQPFGLLRSINGGPLFPHSGTDFAAEVGTPVVAAAAGRVAFAAALHLRGNSVIIDHGSGVFSGYHHLSEIHVSEGQEVSQGQQLGLIGATGLSGGPHLHWEVIVHGVRMDPVLWTFRALEP